MTTTSFVTITSFLGHISVREMIDPSGHAARIKRELKTLGMTWWGFMFPETHYLPRIIHPDEHIGGIVYGQNDEGSVILVATDRRVIYLDKKPLFINEDEISYMAVRGVDFYNVAFYTTITLQTRVKNFKVNTFNQTCARNFVNYIENRCLERPDEA